MCRASALALASASLLLLASPAVAAQYRFVNIVDTRGPFEALETTTFAVGDTGAVAFIAKQGGVTHSFVGDGSSTLSVVPDLSPSPGYPVHLGGINAVNASGIAVGTWRRDGNFEPIEEWWKVLRYDASGSQMIAETTTDGAYTRYVAGDDVNNVGAVAVRHSEYKKGSGPGTEQSSITRWFNGASTTVLDAAEGFKHIDSVRLNEHGDVAFEGIKKEEAGFSYYRTDGTTLTPIAGPYLTDGSASLAINDSGAVAFVEGSGAGNEALYVGDGGPLTTVASANATTPFYSIYDHVDLNNHGTVAFWAELWDGRRGIFTGPDPVNDKVIATGELLFGRFVTRLGVGPTINNRGDVAFWFAVRDLLHPEGEWGGIALAVNESALSGDFNGDHIVDAPDLAQWQGDFGQNGDSDADNDGDSDGADFLAWQRHFGSGPAIAPASDAVPEPASFVLLIVAAAGWCRRRRRTA